MSYSTQTFKGRLGYTFSIIMASISAVILYYNAMRGLALAEATQAIVMSLLALSLLMQAWYAVQAGISQEFELLIPMVLGIVMFSLLIPAVFAGSSLLLLHFLFLPVLITVVVIVALVVAAFSAMGKSSSSRSSGSSFNFNLHYYSFGPRYYYYSDPTPSTVSSSSTSSSSSGHGFFYFMIGFFAVMLIVAFFMVIGANLPPLQTMLLLGLLVCGGGGSLLFALGLVNGSQACMSTGFIALCVFYCLAIVQLITWCLSASGNVELCDNGFCGQVDVSSTNELSTANTNDHYVDYQLGGTSWKNQEGQEPTYQ